MEVDALIRSVTRDLGRSSGDADRMIKLLVEENWLDTMDSLIRLSDDDWKNLGVPMRFAEALKERLHGGGSDKSWVETVMTKPRGVMGLDEMVDALSEVPDAPTTVKTLIRVAENVISNPGDMKMRIFKGSNPTVQRKILSVPFACLMLSLMGFEKEDEDFILKTPDVPHLKNIKKDLEDAASSSSIDLLGPNQNSSIVSLSGYKPPPMTPSELEEVEARALIQRVSEIIKAPLQPNPRRVQQTASPTIEPDGIPDDVLTVEELRTLKERITKTPQFSSLKRKELKAKVSALYTLTGIRTVFPDGSLILMDFRPDSKIGDLRAAIFQHCVAEESAHLEMKLSIHPDTAPACEDRTFREVGCVPTGVFRARMDESVVLKI